MTRADPRQFDLFAAPPPPPVTPNAHGGYPRDVAEALSIQVHARGYATIRLLRLDAGWVDGIDYTMSDRGGVSPLTEHRIWPDRRGALDHAIGDLRRRIGGHSCDAGSATFQRQRRAIGAWLDTL